MPRDGAVILSDLQARGLDRLEIACRLCPRHGSYGLAGAIERWGGDAKLTDILLDLTKDCPRGKGASAYARCGGYYPALVG
jgi:hypothetical protein